LSPSSAISRPSTAWAVTVSGSARGDAANAVLAATVLQLQPPDLLAEAFVVAILNALFAEPKINPV
jgi:hypothetical protein